MTNFGTYELDLKEAIHYGIPLKEYLDYVEDMNTINCEGYLK